MIELLGKRWIFHFDLKGKEMKVELMGNHDFREGETVGLTLRREGILLFDRKSEKRLDVKLD
jgi:ABC-type sugar transport system ATPase subunit